MSTYTLVSFLDIFFTQMGSLRNGWDVFLGFTIGSGKCSVGVWSNYVLLN